MDFFGSAERRSDDLLVSSPFDMSTEIQNITASPDGFCSSSKRPRRMAMKGRANAACNRCRINKRKCVDFRPCPRCSAAGLGESCTTDSEMKIEKPFSFAVPPYDIRRQGFSVDVQLEYQWSFQTVRNVWTMGYSFSTFMKIFNAIPPSMSSALARLMVNLEHILNSRQSSNR